MHESEKKKRLHKRCDCKKKKKMMQPVWKYLTKLNILLPYNLTICYLPKVVENMSTQEPACRYLWQFH